MEISKFKLQETLLDLKDETARQTIDAVQTIAERAEGKADGAQTVAERAEGKADGAQTVADRAEGKADDAQAAASDALTGLTEKQNIISKLQNFTGDIDTLYADTSETKGNNYVYFCDSTAVSGTLPFTTGFFTLIVLRNIQIAFPYKTPATDTSNATVKFRDHTNGWRLWRGANFTV